VGGVFNLPSEPGAELRGAGLGTGWPCEKARRRLPFNDAGSERNNLQNRPSPDGLFWLRACQEDFADFFDGDRATEASVVSTRKTKVSCRYNCTEESVWLR